MNAFRSGKSKLVFAGALALCFLFAQPLRAQKGKPRTTSQDLQLKKKKLDEELKQLSSMLTATRSAKTKSYGDLANINIKIEKRQGLINLINAEIAALNHEIKQNEEQVQRLRNSLEKLKKEYARMILFARRNQDSYNNMMFIFAAENFNQAYARLKYMQQYSDFRKKQAAEIVNTQNELLKKIDELKEQRRQKNILIGNEEEEKKVLNEEKAEKEILLNDLQKKEKNLKQELEKRKQAAAQLQKAIRRLIDDEIRRKNEERDREELRSLVNKVKKAQKDREGKNKTPDKPASEVSDVKPKPTLELTPEAEALSNDFANNRGKLPWPVERGVICEAYGEHEHPAIKNFTIFNSGVEICTPQGSKARAVFSGEVTGIAPSPTGGKLVIIRHGEYLSVYTNLGDVTVKTGQKVGLKQVIGTIQYNDDDGKASINLQIWKGQKTMDPGAWLLNGQ